MRRLKSIRGVEIHATTTGDRVIYIRYESNRKQYVERIGPSQYDDKKRDLTLAEARRRLNARREEIRMARLRGEVWRTPEEQARLEEAARVEAARIAEEAARAVEAERRALLFEQATGRFLQRVED